MFEGVTDPITLMILMLRMRDVQMKILKRKKLIGADETWLRLNLLGPRKGNFRNEKHRDKLLNEWFKGAKILAKRFKAEEEIKTEKK